MNIPEEVVNPVVASVLFAAARESGLSQIELAERANMSRVTVQKVLSGKQGIKLAQYLALANATDLSPAEIMDRITSALARRTRELASTSEAPRSLDELRALKQQQARGMSTEELEAQEKRAAIYDPELESDEPPSP